MKYKKFSIRNFKGIEKLDLDSSNDRIITLVGLNESGKTTIMEALHLFYLLTQGHSLTNSQKNSLRPKGSDFSGKILLEGTVDYESYDIEKINKFIEAENLAYRITLPTVSYSYSYTFIYELHNYKDEERLVTFPAIAVYKTENGNMSKKNLYEYDNKMWNKLVTYIRKELLPEILYYEDFVFNIPEEIAFGVSPPVPGTLEDEKNKTWQLVLDDVIKAVNPKFSSFKEMVVDIWQQDNDTALNRISEIEEVLNKKITTSWKALFQKESNRINFKEIKVAPKIDKTNFKVSFKVKTEKGKLFSINDRSKGCRWFFSFLIFTEFRKNRTQNILFLLDEPASNLHSSAQKKILEAIKELSLNSIVIYSTHSHHLINPKWLAGTYVVINDSLSNENLRGEMTFKDNSKISAIKYFNYVGLGKGSTNFSYFQPILDALDYSPSTIEPIPTIVITEGKFDWYAFNYMNEIILKRNEIKFYPGSGKDSLYDIIRLYLSWGANFLVVLDGDKPSTKAKENYLKEFHPYLSNKIITLKEAANINGSLEDLFTDEDIKKIILSQFKTETYEKEKGNKAKVKGLFNSSLNILSFNKTHLELSSQTKENFTKLLDLISKKIS